MDPTQLLSHHHTSIIHSFLFAIRFLSQICAPSHHPQVEVFDKIQFLIVLL